MKTMIEFNKDTGVTTCIIYDTKNDAIREFEKRSRGIYITDERLLRKFAMPNKFIGISYCADADSFDEHIGEDLAFNRAYEKYLNSLSNALHNIYVDIINRAETSYIEGSNIVAKKIDKRYNEADRIEAMIDANCK